MMHFPMPYPTTSQITASKILAVKWATREFCSLPLCFHHMQQYQMWKTAHMCGAHASPHPSSQQKIFSRWSLIPFLVEDLPHKDFLMEGEHKCKMADKGPLDKQTKSGFFIRFSRACHQSDNLDTVKCIRDGRIPHSLWLFLEKRVALSVGALVTHL